MKKIIIILFIGFLFRVFGLWWDSGFNLHPDERAIILSVLPLHFPTSIHEFLSVESPWNPHFFAYGSFPIYLLKATSYLVSLLSPALATYQYIALLGRFLSIVFDIGTIFIIMKLGKKIWSEQIGLIAGFLYSISVLPIQLSHFYTVDTSLTFFITLCLYLLICFYEKPTRKKAIYIGVVSGIALATKNSAIVLISAITTSLCIDFFLLALRKQYSISFVQHLLFFASTIGIVGAIVFCLLEPYAIISFSEFLSQTMQQFAMTHNAFTFPYTLQYVGKISYLYELENIFFFGLGPIVSLLALGGFIYTVYSLKKHFSQPSWSKQIILFAFFVSYFIIVGNFAIGFMRYMLPVYPILCLLAGILVSKILARANAIAFIILFVIILIWPLSFMHIYTQENTRVQATQWILSNIPQGETLAVEHWDDMIPLFYADHYRFNILELYNHETSEKWAKINQQLIDSDYIIVASNRLYVPLQKLTECASLPPGYCYTKTDQYYKELFSETGGFRKVAEFISYPTIPFTNIQINDQSADESFTVYDHPKVMIYKKIVIQ